MEVPRLVQKQDKFGEKGLNIISQAIPIVIQDQVFGGVMSILYGTYIR